MLWKRNDNVITIRWERQLLKKFGLVIQHRVRQEHNGLVALGLDQEQFVARGLKMAEVLFQCMVLDNHDACEEHSTYCLAPKFAKAGEKWKHESYPGGLPLPFADDRRWFDIMVNRVFGKEQIDTTSTGKTTTALEQSHAYDNSRCNPKGGRGNYRNHEGFMLLRIATERSCLGKGLGRMHVLKELGVNSNGPQARALRKQYSRGLQRRARDCSKEARYKRSQKRKLAWTAKASEGTGDYKKDCVNPTTKKKGKSATTRKSRRNDQKDLVANKENEEPSHSDDALTPSCDDCDFDEPTASSAFSMNASEAQHLLNICERADR